MYNNSIGKNFLLLIFITYNIFLEEVYHQASFSYANNNYEYPEKNELLPYDVHLAKLDYEEFGCVIISQTYRFIGINFY